MGEESQVIQLHVEARDWSEAFRLAEHLPQVLSSIHYQHAQWLAVSDQFRAAHEAYVLAGKPNEATNLLRSLVDCAVSESRFLDASYFTWLRAKQILKFMDEENQAQKLNEYKSLLKLASIYYSYNTINSYLKEPFTSSPPLTLFNTSRYVINQINGANPPKGISLFAIYYTLSKQAKVLGANKLHLQVNNKLQSLKAPPGVQEQVDINYITSRSCPNGFNDPEELLPMCYKCSNYSPHLQGNQCPNCRQEYVFSCVSFEILPLAEFAPEPGINEQEAERLLMAPPKSSEFEQQDQFIQEDIGDTLTMSMDRDSLRSIEPREVIIVKWPAPLKTKYYRNLLPELQITVCPECNQAFHSEDFELQFLKNGYCPFCRKTEELD